MIYKLYCLTRLLFYPLILLLSLFLPKIKKRMSFESKEFLGFDPTQKEVQYAFEVSSEGELEQAYCVIEGFLQEGLAIELLYCSESVEQSCLNLQKKYPNQVNLKTLAVLSFFPGKKLVDPNLWITANCLVLCRYDFFPELIHFGKKSDQTLKLISASLTNFASKNIFFKAYLSFCYRQFTTIIAASKEDERKFIDLLDPDLKIELSYYDFRIPRIQKRVLNAHESLREKFPFFHHFHKNILSKKYHKRRIFGSFWPYETKIFENTLGEDKYLLCLAPHNVDDRSVQNIIKGLGAMDTYIIHDGITEKEYLALYNQFCINNGIWIFKIKGVLCELYSYFDEAYVGGGFGVSVHSLLEPYLSGCQVICGPKVFRSSEYRWIKENRPDSIKIASDLDYVWDEMKELSYSSLNVTFKERKEPSEDGHRLTDVMKILVEKKVLLISEGDTSC